MRKKFATVGHAKISTKAQAQSFFEKCGPVYQFVGKAGHAHRVFVFSADTFYEAGPLAAPQGKPWCTPPVWSATADPLLEFMLSQTGPSDILVLCDGRSKACRRKLDDYAEKARNVNEVWVIYKPTPRLGRSVSFASENREMLWVSLPVNRTLISCKPRSEYTCTGESSTHDSTYSGVEPMPWPAMPLISAADKEKVHGVAPAAPRGKVFDTSMGHPLFWQERKTPKFWMQLLVDLDAKAVFDLTPSGSLGRACLEKGILYTALAKNAEHNSWLQNLFDRHAMGIITTTGTTLYEQDLAQCVTDHFQDVLDQLHQQDACEDLPPEEEDDSSGNPLALALAAEA